MVNIFPINLAKTKKHPIVGTCYVMVFSLQPDDDIQFPKKDFPLKSNKTKLF